MNDVIINDNSFLRQFETTVNGHLARIEYSSQERKVFLTKLVVPEEITDESFRENFIKAVLSIIQERNLRVVPTTDLNLTFALSLSVLILIMFFNKIFSFGMGTMPVSDPANKSLSVDTV